MPTANDLLTRWPGLDIALRRDRLQPGFQQSAGRLAPHLPAFHAAAERAVAGLWNREPSLWSADAEVQAKIANRLGWLTSPGLMADQLDTLTRFAASVREAGFTDVVLLGMGGSSLAPEVLRAVVGSGAQGLRLHMIDSTDPAAVLAIDTDIRKTVYIFASKSGTTIEPNSLYGYFRSSLENADIKPWASQFIAITDEGTELAFNAKRRRFREIFINPTDIGGRYSAISYFGMVPAALMGQDVAAIVGWALAMLASTEPGTVNVAEHSAFALGIAMAAGARHGRDKLTLLVPPGLESFGLWVE